MNNDTIIDTGADQTRFNASLYPGPTVFDARADVNDDGNRDSGDSTPWAAKEATWDELTPTVAQAYSDIDNPFMFQGTRHFAIDTGWSDTTAKLPLNHHRARFADPCEGRWVTRDPLYFNKTLLLPYDSSAPEVEVTSPTSIDIPIPRLLGNPRPLSIPPYSTNSYVELSNSPTSALDSSGLASTCAFAGGQWRWVRTRIYVSVTLTTCSCIYVTTGPRCLGHCSWWYSCSTADPCVADYDEIEIYGSIIIQGPNQFPFCDCATPSGSPGGTCGCP